MLEGRLDMFGWFRELHGDGSCGCVMVTLLRVIRCEWMRRALFLLSGSGLTRVNFCSWLFQGKLGEKPLLSKESVIASSVTRVSNGLVKGCSGGRILEEEHRKEGTRAVSLALSLPKDPILPVTKIISMNLLPQFFLFLLGLEGNPGDL